MRFERTDVSGVFVVEPEPREDERGWFARTWCREEFAERGLDAELSQCSISFNHRKGTLRGMHLQAPPHAEAKLVRVTRGAIFDAVVDLRRDSPTFLGWAGVPLDESSRRMLYVPKGCAQGFLTLCDGAEVFYQISEPYHPEAARGYRWDDPAFGIAWPASPEVVSERDRGFRAYRP